MTDKHHCDRCTDPPVDFGWWCKCGMSGPHAEDFEAHECAAGNANVAWASFMTVVGVAIVIAIWSAA